MTTWTSDQVLALAPDSSSAKAGEGIANPSKWVSTGAGERAVWGEAKGSAATPYQTCIDLGEPAFKCSCPSRKFPCKHALGLFLLYVKGACPAGPPPPWAQEWLGKREAKASAPPAAARAEVDEAAQERRAAKREERVAAGLRECGVWLRDTIRRGLSDPDLASARYWDGFAARMVDAQAPGVARRIREMGETVSSGAGWQERLLDRLGALHLLLEAHTRIESLPEPNRADVRTGIGWTLRKEDLPPELAVEDEWTVVGQRAFTEDRLKVQRSWLRGAALERWAMVLAFSVGGQPFDTLLVPGTALRGSVAFFPSAYPLRAAILDRADACPAPVPGGTVAQALDGYASTLAQNPWIETYPMALRGARLAAEDGRWQAVDPEGVRIPLPAGFESGWRLLAVSGGAPVDLFGEWDGREFLPLSAVVEGRFLQL